MPSHANGPGANRAAADTSLRGDSLQHSTKRSDAKVEQARLRHLVRCVHALGPRPVGELLLELAGDHPRLIERLEAYAAWDPQTVHYLDASDWRALPLRVVA